MQFLPKTHERYRAALRMYMQSQLLRHGINDDIRKRLATLFYTDVMLSAKHLVPTEPIIFADRLLGAAEMRLMRNGGSLSVLLSGGGYIYEDRKLLAALLLRSALCALENKAGELRVCFIGQRLTVSFKGKTDKMLDLIIKRLYGTVFRILPDNVTTVFIKYRSPAKYTEPIADEWEYLLDPLSLVNILLSDDESDG